MPRLTGVLKRVFPLAFAVFMGVVAVTLARQWVNRKEQEFQRRWEEATANLRNPIPIVVARTDLAEGLELTPAHLTTAKIPEQFIQPYAVKSPGPLLGKVTMAPIAEGEQVLLNKVRIRLDVPEEAILSDLMQEGDRAITIGVDSLTGVGGFVRPGDVVDIMWTLQLKRPGGQEDTVTWTLFQGIEVLAVAREMLGRSTTSTTASDKHTVTLAMTPQNAAFLLYAREQGRIQLSLRPDVEGVAAVATVPANAHTLMERVLGVPTAPPAPTAHQVEVYKGLEREIVSLSEEGQ